MKTLLPEFKTICGRCNNYYVSPCGTRETCDAQRQRNTNMISVIDDDYVAQRMIGEKNNCKEFKKL